MNLSAYLHITQKGMDEVKLRHFKLALRARSLLILLDSPKTIENVLQKTLYTQNESIEEIQTLVRDGFLVISSIGTPDPALTGVSKGNTHLVDDIALSEGKFLLVDFCVDSFGTQSQAFVDQVRACGSAKELDLQLCRTVEAVKTVCPDRLPILLGLVKEINATA